MHLNIEQFLRNRERGKLPRPISTPHISRPSLIPRSLHIPILLALVALALAGCSKPKAGEEESPEAAPVAVTVAKVERKDIRDTVPVDGSFVIPQGQSSRLAPAVQGRISKILVKEGDHVNPGQLLAIIDTRVLAAQNQSAAQGAAAATAQAGQTQLDYKAAQADYATGVLAARLALEAAVAERDSNVQAAQVQLQKLRNGARPQEIAQAEQAVAQARVSRDKARRDADREKALAAEGFVAGQDADAAQSAFQLAQSALQQAISALDLVRAGARPEDLRAAEIALRSARDLGDKKVAQAKASLRQAEEGKLSVAAKQRAAASAELSARQKSADAAAALQTLRNSEIRSPISGVVVQRLLNEGDMADTTTPVIEVATGKSSVDFVGTVSPADAANIRTGMAVDFPSLSSVNGRVTAVGVANPQTGLVPIRAACSGLTSQTRAGAFATARIVLYTLRDATSVPKEAVLNRDGKDEVFVVKEDAAHLTPVTIGPADSGDIAIRKGVSPGETVILVGQHELSDGAKVEVSTPDKAGSDEKSGAGDKG